LRVGLATQGMTIPANALLFRAEGLQVAVVRNGRAELVPVKLGRDYGRSVEVVAGLKPTDMVILDPADSLVSGTAVRVRAPERPKDGAAAPPPTRGASPPPPPPWPAGPRASGRPPRRWRTTRPARAGCRPPGLPAGRSARPGRSRRGDRSAQSSRSPGASPRTRGSTSATRVPGRRWRWSRRRRGGTGARRRAASAPPPRS